MAYFLFDVQRGYFDYFSSAMVVMLRSLGIPSRIAVGYIIRTQDKVPDTDTYVISEGNAFAWPEVYFPNLGWVEFNPTPNEAAIVRSASDDQDLASGDLTDVPPDEPLPEDLFPQDEPAGPALDALQNNGGSNLVGNILMGLVLVFLGVTVAGGLTFQFAWQRGLGGLDYPSQIWEKTQRLARWARIPTYPQQTPREYVARLQHELPDVEDVPYLGDTYVRSRYGGKKLEDSERARLTAVWKSVRNTLLGRLMRWR